MEGEASSGFIFGSLPRQHGQDRSNAAGGIGEVPDFFGAEGAGEDGALPVGEPLLEDLVAAELVAPDGGGDVAQEGVGIEVDVEGRVAVAESVQRVAKGCALFRGVGAFDGSALAGHHGIADAVVAPTGGDGEIVARHVVLADGCGDGDGGDRWPQRRSGDAGDWSIGVEESGKLAPVCR